MILVHDQDVEDIIRYIKAFLGTKPRYGKREGMRLLQQLNLAKRGYPEGHTSDPKLSKYHTSNEGEPPDAS